MKTVWLGHLKKAKKKTKIQTQTDQTERICNWKTQMIHDMRQEKKTERPNNWTFLHMSPFHPKRFDRTMDDSSFDSFEKWIKPKSIYYKLEHFFMRLVYSKDTCLFCNMKKKVSTPDIGHSSFYSAFGNLLTVILQWKRAYTDRCYCFCTTNLPTTKQSYTF